MELVEEVKELLREAEKALKGSALRLYVSRSDAPASAIPCRRRARVSSNIFTVSNERVPERTK